MPEGAQAGLNAGAWQPLLTGAWRERALEAIEAIAESLRPGSPALAMRGEAVDPSLGGGATGLALLFAYMARAIPKGEYAAEARHWLDQAVQGVSDVGVQASLYGGLIGVAWAVAHLRGQLPEFDTDSIGVEIDEVLLEHLGQSPWSETYDLIDGLVGLGVYALERGPHAASAVACLERVIACLAETSEPRPEGITWQSRADWLPPEKKADGPRRYYDLGLAHGIPGVIALLGRVCAAGVAASEAESLLEGAARWLMVRRAMVGTDGFPYRIEPGLPPVPGRLAWCYGDPGVAASLLLAARYVGKQSWERAALRLAHRAAERPADEAGVFDAGLCHGAAGLGHLFNRLFQATRDPRLAEAAQFWFQRTLELRRPQGSIAGFAAWGPGPDGSLNWTDDPGLLTGAAGIALALLAAVTPVEPGWDRVMLVSIPPLAAASNRNAEG
jgi:lantibiotic modifying enzyme